MASRKFRYMFHAVPTGTIFTSSAWKVGSEDCDNLIYMGGSNHKLGETADRDIKTEAKEHCREDIPLDVFEHADMAVLGDFDIPHIKHFLELLMSVPVGAVFYPVVTPECRQAVLEKIDYICSLEKGRYELGNEKLVTYEEMIQFLQHPYFYLAKRYKRTAIYPISGNGAIYMGGEADAVAMDPLPEDEMVQIRRVEGYEIPAVRAGYIVKNDMLYQFGSFGESLSLYISPLNNGPAHDDCQLQVKNTVKREDCNTMEAATSGRCSAYCMFKSDWEVCKKHNRQEMPYHINGMMLPGSLDWNEYGSQFIQRFATPLSKTRVIMVPGNGQAVYWNKMLAKLDTKGHHRFWVGGGKINDKVLKDIICINGDHRFLKVDENSGVCVVGIITPLNRLEL